MRNTSRRLIDLAVALALCGCGGGGGSSDRTAPVVEGLRVVRNTANQPEITIRTTDAESGIAAVTAVVTQSSLAGPVNTRVPLAPQTVDEYGGMIPDTSVRFYVEASDNSGNTIQSAETLVPPPDPGL